MRLSKELKFNIVIAFALIVLDVLWNEVTQNKYSETQFVYPYFVLNFTFNFCFFLIYVLNYLFIAPRLLLRKNFFLYAISILMMIFLFIGVRYVLDEIVYYSIFGYHNYDVDADNFYSTYVYGAFYYVLRACLYSSIVYLLFNAMKNKDRIHQLEIEFKKAELASVKSQISPHFLFNTLNSFYEELYDSKPKTADDLLRLSQLLRYVAEDVDKNFAFLEKELTFLEDYIYFYRKRFEDRFYLNYSVTKHVTGKKIPALILIHFIENVCKHGIINDPNYPAEITITIEQGFLELTTKNKILTTEKYTESGIGTVNVRKRLTGYFGQKYTLQYSHTEHYFKAYLKFPL